MYDASISKWLYFWTSRFIQMTSLRLNISPCQRATTLVLIPFYNPSFSSENHQKNIWALPYFCLGCLLKPASVTSFSQLRLSRNSGSSRSLYRIVSNFIKHSIAKCKSTSLSIEHCRCLIALADFL